MIHFCQFGLNIGSPTLLVVWFVDNIGDEAKGLGCVSRKGNIEQCVSVALETARKR